MLDLLGSGDVDARNVERHAFAEVELLRGVDAPDLHLDLREDLVKVVTHRCKRLGRQHLVQEILTFECLHVTHGSLPDLPELVIKLGIFDRLLESGERHSSRFGLVEMEPIRPLHRSERFVLLRVVAVGLLALARGEHVADRANLRANLGDEGLVARKLSALQLKVVLQLLDGVLARLGLEGREVAIHLALVGFADPVLDPEEEIRNPAPCHASAHEERGKRSQSNPGRNCRPDDGCDQGQSDDATDGEEGLLAGELPLDDVGEVLLRLGFGLELSLEARGSDASGIGLYQLIHLKAPSHLLVYLEPVSSGRK